MSDKLFADDISLFSVVHDSVASSAFLYDDILKISRWDYHRDLTQISQNRHKKLFSFANQVQLTMDLVFFNNAPIIVKIIQKHLGLFPYSRLNLFDHANENRLLKGSFL